MKPFWKKNPYNQPRPIDPPPAPTEEHPRRNGIFINEKERSIQVVIYENGETSISMGLGSLEMAKDVLKQQLTAWHMREKPRAGILVPSNGRPH